MDTSNHNAEQTAHQRLDVPPYEPVSLDDLTAARMKLAAEIKTVFDGLDPLEKGNVSGLIDQLDFANQDLARCAEMLADAKAVNDTARSKASEKYSDDFPATRLRIRLDGDCVDEGKLLSQAERLSALLVHRIDSIRTLISLEKALYLNQSSGAVYDTQPTTGGNTQATGWRKVGP